MKYFAFISYSHRDASWGEWLHRGLERYRVPRGLVGRATTRGEPVPARVYPVFRDREELPTAVDLGAVITNALRESRYLVVICSPASARSQWVNEEILNYKRLGRENRVLAIIVDGEPNAADGKPGFAPEQECFPPALKFKLGPDGALSTERTEPIAADARPHADGRDNALLKLLAGVLGVGFDDLRQREAARRRRRRLMMAAVAALACAGTWIVQSRFAAERAERQYQASVAELGQARRALVDGRAGEAAALALGAVERAEAAGRELEPAWWVLRRAVEADRVENRWRATSHEVDDCVLSGDGTRLLTFSRAEGEAKVWSVPDGRLLIRCAAGTYAYAAAWTAGDREIVTVRERVRDAASPGIDLVWWDPASGERLRSVEIPGCAISRVRVRGEAPPGWIVVDQYDESGEGIGYRLVRLADGRSDLLFERPRDAGWTTGPVVVPSCGVALFIDPDAGVRLHRLEDGAQLGTLAGIGAGKHLQLRSLVPARDGRSFAAIVWTDGEVNEAGVWSALDGGRLVAWRPGDASATSGIWLARVAGDRVSGRPAELVAAAAGPLGLATIEGADWDVDQLLSAEREGIASPLVLASLDRYGQITCRVPSVAWEAPAELEGAAAAALDLDPTGSRLAIGDERGVVTLWRTVPPVDTEPGLAGEIESAGEAGRGEPRAPIVLRTAADGVTLWDPVAWSTRGEARGFVPPEKTWMEFRASGQWRWLLAVPHRSTVEAVPSDWRATVHDLGSGAITAQWPVTEYVLAPDGVRVLAPAVDGWHVLSLAEPTRRPVMLKPTHAAATAWASRAVFLGDGRRVAVVTGAGWVGLFAADSGEQVGAIEFAPGLDTSINACDADPAGRWLLLATHDSWWRIDLERARAERIFVEGERPDGSWRFLDEGGLIVGQVGWSKVQWWTFPELQPIASWKDHADLHSLQIEPVTGNLLLADDSAGELVCVERGSGTARTRYSGVKFVDRAGRMAVVRREAGEGGSVQIIRLSDGEVLRDLGDLAVGGGFFSADGSRVALALLSAGDPLVVADLRLDRATVRAQAERTRQRVRAATEAAPAP